MLNVNWGFPAGLESTCNAGDQGLTPGLEKSPGEENGNPLQYSCLENPMNRGTWWAILHGVTKSHDWATKHTCTNVDWNNYYSSWLWKTKLQRTWWLEMRDAMQFFSALLLLSHFSRIWLCDPIDGSPPGSSVPGILQARVLGWVAISFSSAYMHAKSLQSCPTLCDPMDSSPPGSSVHSALETIKISVCTQLRLETCHQETSYLLFILRGENSVEPWLGECVRLSLFCAISQKQYLK